MTRETKVGLLVGMAVILLIGILVSDFLAEAQKPAEMTQFANQLQQSISPQQIEQDPLTTNRLATGSFQPGGALDASTHTERQTPVRMPGEGADASITSDPQPDGGQRYLPPEAKALTDAGERQLSLDEIIARARFAEEQRRLAAQTGVSTLSPSAAQSQSPSAARFMSQQGQDFNDTTSIGQIASTNDPTGRTPGGPGALGTPGALGAPGASEVLLRGQTPVADPPGVYHTVQRGESLYHIARKYYQNGEYWRMIKEANPDSVGANGEVRAGVQLRIPMRSDVTRLPGFQAVGSARTFDDVAPAPPDSPESPAPPAPSVLTGHGSIGAPTGRTAPTVVAAGNRSAFKVVTVQSSQTLSELASTHLGSSRRWPELLAANRDKLDSAEELQEGMELRIPLDDHSNARTLSVQNVSTTRSTVSVDRRNASRALPPRAALIPLASSDGKTYVVKPNDSLYSIAAVQLGNGNRWREILAANRKVITDAKALTVGQKLTLPKR